MAAIATVVRANSAGSVASDQDSFRVLEWDLFDVPRTDLKWQGVGPGCSLRVETLTLSGLELAFARRFLGVRFDLSEVTLLGDNAAQVFLNWNVYDALRLRCKIGYERQLDLRWLPASHINEFFDWLRRLSTMRNTLVVVFDGGSVVVRGSI